MEEGESFTTQPVHQLMTPVALRILKVYLNVTFSLPHTTVAKILAIFYLKSSGVHRSRYQFENDILNLNVCLQGYEMVKR